MHKLFKYRKNKLRRQEALCVALALSIAAAVGFSFNTEHSYWIPMTVGLIFAVPVRGMILQRAFHRTVGTLIGLMFSFLYIKTMMFSDYRWAYLLPLILLLINYLFMVTNVYAFAVIVITLLVPLLDTVMGTPDFSIDLVLAKRFEFTIIAVVIALLCEFFIHKNASISSRRFKMNTRNHFHSIGEILDSCLDCFIGKNRMSRELLLTLKKSVATLSSTEAIYSYLKIEYEYEEDKKDLMVYVFNKLNKMNVCIRKLICITNHESFTDSCISKEQFKNICDAVSEKYKFMVKFKYGRKPKKIPGIQKIVNEVKNHNQMSPVYFYLEEIFELNRLLNEFMERTSVESNSSRLMDK